MKTTDYWNFWRWILLRLWLSVSLRGHLLSVLAVRLSALLTLRLDHLLGPMMLLACHCHLALRL